MTIEKMGVREKILTAAADLARNVGPGNIALDAVAAKAGVSKGGLLYHFPSKAKLLEALVERYLIEFEAALAEREKRHEGAPDSLVTAYIELFVAEKKQLAPPPSGLLAAMAENPGFLAPVRRFRRALLDRLKANTRFESRTLTIYLALEGMRSMHLFDTDVLSEAEREGVIRHLFSMLAGKD